MQEEDPGNTEHFKAKQLIHAHESNLTSHITTSKYREAQLINRIRKLEAEVRSLQLTILSLLPPAS